MKCLHSQCEVNIPAGSSFCSEHQPLGANPFPIVKPDMVNSPPHYKDTVPGIECIEVVKHFSFVRGNAIKYLWRAGAKSDLKEDLEKAIWYINKEIEGLDD